MKIGRHKGSWQSRRTQSLFFSTGTSWLLELFELGLWSDGDRIAHVVSVSVLEVGRIGISSVRAEETFWKEEAGGGPDIVKRERQRYRITVGSASAMSYLSERLSVHVDDFVEKYEKEGEGEDDWDRNQGENELDDVSLRSEVVPGDADGSGWRKSKFALSATVETHWLETWL